MNCCTCAVVVVLLCFCVHTGISFLFLYISVNCALSTHPPTPPHPHHQTHTTAPPHTQLPVGTRQPLPYICTILPPTALALVQPDLFFSALDVAGTYGVLVLFGILPALMVYSERYGGTTLSQYQLVPGGRVVLGLVGGAAVMVIVNEIVTTVMESVS